VQGNFGQKKDHRTRHPDGLRVSRTGLEPVTR
jgi:hypothetical protein